MRTVIIFFCAVLLLAAGCAQVPRPATFPYSSEQPLQSETSYYRQQQLQSATHWQLFAKLTTQRISSNPDLLDLLKSKSGGSTPRLSIEASDQSPFGQAFRGYLITELMNGGFLLSDAPDGPINLRWSTHLISRGTDRTKQIPGVPEFIFNLVRGIFIGGGWYTSDARVPNTELIITTSITIGEDTTPTTIKRYTDIFYINDADWNNFSVARDYVYGKSIAGKEEAWRQRLTREGWLSK